MSKELIDVLDENGVKTGKVLDRGAIHKNGLWHRAIAVAIINGKQEILLQQRAENKEKNAGMWDISVAGHISAGQNSKDAALREISEEIGIEISKNELEYIFSYRMNQKVSDEFIENQFYDFYIVKNDNIKIENIKIQESELQDIKFVDLSTLNKMLDEHIIVDRKPIYDELVNYLK